MIYFHSAVLERRSRGPSPERGTGAPPQMKHPWRALLLFCAARASVVLEPSPSRPLATTTLKFFGPHTFSLNTTGSPLIELNAANLARIHRDDRASTDLTGAIILFSFSDNPNSSLDWLYIALERAGVTAAIVTTTLFSLPGAMYFVHEGTGELTRRGPMPMLQVAFKDVRDLIEAARAGVTVSFLLEPTENKFLLLYRGWWYILVIRGLMPLLGFTTGALALKNLRAHVRLGGRSILYPPTKPVMVLVSEMLVCPVLGVVTLCGPHGSNDAWTITTRRFFASMLTGWSLFTTLIMAVGVM